MKKLLSILIVTVMLLGLLPVTSFAAESYDLWVGDAEVTNENLSGEGWSYEPSTNTLTLDGFSYEGAGHVFKKTGNTSNSAAGITYLGENELNIVVQGTGVVKLVYDEGDSPYETFGIYSPAPLKIAGSNMLKVDTCDVSTTHDIYGIYSGAVITVDGPKVTAESGTGYNTSCGIRAISSIYMISGELTASTRSGNFCYGISTRVLTATGGMISAIGGFKARQICAGINVDSGATFGNCEVEATGQTESSEYLLYDYGIIGNIEIKDTVKSFIARGSTAAFSGTVKNAVPGAGWNTAFSYVDPETIPVSTEGATLSYKEVEFPFVSYDMWFGEDQVTSLRTFGPGWKYEPESNTLTLHDYTYSGDGHVYFLNSYVGNVRSSILYTGNRSFNLEIIGENHIVQTNTGSLSSCPISSVTDINIYGGGFLEVAAGTTDSSSYAIIANNDVSIDGVSIKASGSDGAESGGIVALNSLSIKNSEVYATSATAEKRQSLGIGANNGTITVDGGKLTAIGGTARLGFSGGIFARYGATFKNCITEAVAGTGIGSHGIYSGDNAPLKIEDTVISFIAVGENGATRNMNVTNGIAGRGWDNSEGTGDGEAIPVNTNGAVLNHKKVEFIHTHKYTVETVDDKYIASAATCTEPESYYKLCSVCGEPSATDTFTYGTSLGHDLGDWETTKEPTCTKKGSKVKRCSRCDYTEPGEIDELGHDWVENADEQYLVNAASCTAPAEYYVSCSRCGIADTNNTFTSGQSLGHDLGDWETVTEPTCTDKGSKIKRCSRCTYTEPGEIPALGHKWVEEAKEQYLANGATCTAPAEYYKSCERCKIADTDNTFTYGTSLGHDLGDWETVTGPTCTDKGSKVRKCSRCRYAEDGEIDELGHDYEAVVTDPTCTEDGFTTYTCSRCGDTYTDDPVKALGHDYEAVVTPPGCETEGFTTMKCRRCNDAYKDNDTIVAALGHEWDGGKETKPATESAEGEKTFTCKLCGETKTEKIAKLTPKKEEPKKETQTASAQTGDDITTLLFIATLALTSGAALVIFKKKVFDK